jgi:hypothetical protein
MSTTIHKEIHGSTAVGQAVSTVQAVLSVPVNRTVDRQHLAGKIIDLQKALNALYPGSVPVNKTIDDQDLSAKLIAIQKLIP